MLAVYFYKNLQEYMDRKTKICHPFIFHVSVTVVVCTGFDPELLISLSISDNEVEELKSTPNISKAFENPQFQKYRCFLDLEKRRGCTTGKKKKKQKN